MLGSVESEMVRLISREIMFQEFEPIWSRYLNVTDRRTDRRTTCLGNTARAVVNDLESRSGVIQSHRFWYQSKARIHILISGQ